MRGPVRGVVRRAALRGVYVSVGLEVQCVRAILLRLVVHVRRVEGYGGPVGVRVEVRCVVWCGVTRTYTLTASMSTPTYSMSRYVCVCVCVLVVFGVASG